MALTVIIQEIAMSGNLGAIARVMANFGVTDLVLVNPRLSKEDVEEIKRAKHAQAVLKNAKIVKTFNPKKFDYIIGTTARLGTDYNMSRSPLTPQQLVEKLKEIQGSKVGLWFGREGDGLTNEEISRCDFIVSIPSHKKYPSLNISHAVGIILYELFSLQTNKSTDHFRPASQLDREIAYTFIGKVIETLEFATPDKKQTQYILWKKILGKSMLTKRECFALIGFFKKFL